MVDYLCRAEVTKCLYGMGPSGGRCKEPRIVKGVGYYFGSACTHDDKYWKGGESKVYVRITYTEVKYIWVHVAFDVCETSSREKHGVIATRAGMYVYAFCSTADFCIMAQHKGF